MKAKTKEKAHKKLMEILAFGVTLEGKQTVHPLFSERQAKDIIEVIALMVSDKA